MLSIKIKKYANKISKIFACIMPILLLLYVVSLMFSFDLSVNYKTYDVVYYELRNIQKDINLLTGNLNSPRQQIWIGDWGDVPTLEWVDDNNLLINNKEYNVAEFLNTKSVAK